MFSHNEKILQHSFALFLSMTIGISSVSVALAQPSLPNQPSQNPILEHKIETPLVDGILEGTPRLHPSLSSAQGMQQVVVQLREKPLAVLVSEGDAVALQTTQAENIRQQQDQFINQFQAFDSNTIKVVATTRVALNAVILEIDATALSTLATHPEVLSINPVVDYVMDLSETVPYIGATAVQQSGYDGKGVRVAVLDSGIDYTHVAFKGAGTLEAYEAAWGKNASDQRNTTRDGLFPTEQVIEGYDFVGEAWDRTTVNTLSPDLDPIDRGGHGSHVADIIGGVKGVAPNVSLYAVKVCSAITSACSGVAMIQGVDYALDPNGDGLLNDKVDIINMSIGSPYGQAFDDDLSTAIDNASRQGVLTVASAGNSSDKPYITGTPAGAISALSVAQTFVPSAFLQLININTPASIAGTYASIFQPWSGTLPHPIEASVQYGDGKGGNLNGCADFSAGSLSGKIVFVDRGGCTFSSKIYRIQQGGGIVGIIGLIAPGDPFSSALSNDTPTPTIQAFMINQNDANRIKSGLNTGVVAKVDPTATVSLAKHMVSTSSRGPTLHFNSLPKPEIGAPGASISAVAGTGTGTAPFSGTSGAAPMVSGAAALLRQAYPSRPISELKPLLMNTAETELYNRSPFFGGDKAPITRIGGGEVRVNRALAAPAAVWDQETQSGTLAFGFVDVTKKNVVLKRQARVRNYSDKAIIYKITPSFRFADDEKNGAVRFLAPKSVVVPPSSAVDVMVIITIDGSKLREWGLNSGTQGANADTLTTFEYDGYIVLDNPATPTTDDLHLAWHVLPRLAANISVNNNQMNKDPIKLHPRDDDNEAKRADIQVTLRNTGAGTGRINSYSLIGVSPNMPEGGRGEQKPTPDLRYVGVQTTPVAAGICSADPSFIVSFAINTWERQIHANAPARFEVNLDTNRDGTTDYIVFNSDLSTTRFLPAGLDDGRNAVFTLNTATNSFKAFFFTDHGTNSKNTVLTICAEQIGLNKTNLSQMINATVISREIYFSGAVVDTIEGITFAPGGERYSSTDKNGNANVDIPTEKSAVITIKDRGTTGTNPSETGVLLLLDAARTGGIKGGAPADQEAIAFTVKP